MNNEVSNGLDLFSGSEDAVAPRLDVVKLDYVESGSMTWQELFSGFDRMKAITFSSGIGFVYQLLDLFKDAEIRQDFVRELSLEDYFSEKVTGKYAIQTIRTAWQANPRAFEVNARTNTLRYIAGENWDAVRLMKELPETLCAKRSRDSVIMDLDAAREFFGIDFRKRSIIRRIFGK